MASAWTVKPIRVENSQRDALPPWSATARPRTSSRTASGAIPITTGRPPPGPSSSPPPSLDSTTTSPSNRRCPLPSERSLSHSHLPPLRPPNPAKKVTGRDELHTIITRQALAEEQQSAAKRFILQQRQRSLSLADLGVAASSASTSTASSPLILPAEVPCPPLPPIAVEGDRPRATMAHRTTSLDSTASSLTSGATPTQRQAGPQDIADLIAAAGGSAEGALRKLFAEKQQASSHEAQLWRLVEKQRAMILGLNKDLEKALKEKERYRKKLKDHLAEVPAAPILSGIAVQMNESGRADSQSPASSDRPQQTVLALAASLRESSLDDRKASDASDGPFQSNFDRSDTPQDAINVAAQGTARAPRTTVVTTPDAREAGPSAAAYSDARVVSSPSQRPSLDTLSSRNRSATSAAIQSPTTRPSHKPSISSSSIPSSPFQPSSPPAPAHLSSPKTRKAPPAPLKLKQELDLPLSRHVVDVSDSEYEDDPESARFEYVERGRRKTREEDDRQREALAQEQENRSRSMRDKPGKTKVTAQQVAIPVVKPPNPVRETVPVTLTEQPAVKAPVYQPTGTPADIARSRAVSDAANRMPRNITAPSLLSPGLPMSPRPSDRPLNSPMPRAPMNSIPMSPRAGLPLSPRAPRQPIPLPPQTPLSAISPHLDRAKAYHNFPPMSLHLATNTSNIDHTSSSSAEDTPSSERTLSANEAHTPVEVYRGLMTEQHPDLLLPPNALPSIYVKTASSRMTPSRSNLATTKSGDENQVFTLAIHERSEDRQLWRLEKTFNALSNLHQQIRTMCAIGDRLPDKTFFKGDAPARIDARRIALNTYFEHMLDSIVDEQAAEIVCRFLSNDVLGAENVESLNSASGSRPDTPVNKLRPNRAGYLTKRGKNFGGWKARYFVLDGPILKYFEGPGGAQLGIIKLQNAQIGKQSSAQHNSQEDEDNQFRHAFLVLEPKKKDSASLMRHVLCAENDEERDAWVEALMQYVDYKDEEDLQAARQAQVHKADIGQQRSPRSQKSMNDLRPPVHKSAAQARSMEMIHSVSYNDTVAGDAPIIGSPSSPQLNHTPSPPWDKVHSAEITSTGHPTISSPTNLQVIQNTSDWGMKPPPTPNTAKDRKRSVFQLIHRQNRPSTESIPEKAQLIPLVNVRAVFGVPLAEAVEIARPPGADTELPVVVYRCIEYLMARNAVAEEGIFRLSGSNTVIRALKERFNTEGDVNLVTDGTYYDVHAIASLLKLYLRELPASILTRELHLEFLECLNMSTDNKVVALNGLVHRLPLPNRALLDALSAFLLAIVNNVEVNKMNVRNLGVVFSPTLNLPGPLISLFVEEQERIFGAPIDPVEFPVPSRNIQIHAPPSPPTDLRSPRKQMFSDLPTPAYNQTQFQNLGGLHPDDTGMIPMHPTYASYQMAPQGEGGFGSLNDALRSPMLSSSSGQPIPRDVKAQRRESAMLFNSPNGPTKQPSLSRLREEGAEF